MWLQAEPFGRPLASGMRERWVCSLERPSRWSADPFLTLDAAARCKAWAVGDGSRGPSLTVGVLIGVDAADSVF